MNENISNNRKSILSLFDLTGNWSRLYLEQGYEVIRIDIQHGFDLFHWNYKAFPRDYFTGVLCAIPCTDFALSGGRWFERKDQNGDTYESMALTYRVLAIIQYFQPGLKWWVIENPMSRIHKLCTELGPVTMKFNPHEFAGYDPIPRNSQYQKQTWLWGQFNEPAKKPLSNADGAKYHTRLGGKSICVKNIRSITPLGFAYAFAEANP
jgi:hypothetical protein